MPMMVLLETSFLMALNPRDRNHGWALQVLEKAKQGDVIIHISPAALIELALILKSRGFNEGSIREAIEAMNDIIVLFTKPRYPKLTLDVVAYAVELRTRYKNLTFFDAIHA